MSNSVLGHIDKWNFHLEIYSNEQGAAKKKGAESEL